MLIPAATVIEGSLFADQSPVTPVPTPQSAGPQPVTAVNHLATRWGGAAAGSVSGKIALNAVPKSTHVVFSSPKADNGDARRDNRFYEAAISGVASTERLAVSTIYGDGYIHRQHSARVVAAWQLPNIVLMRDVLSDNHCAALIERARPLLKPSSVAGRDDATGKASARRTSESAYLVDPHWPLIQQIESLIADLTGIPASHGEDLSVVCYRPGQESKQHFDYFMPQRPSTPRYARAEAGGQRLATFILYLNTVIDGGETEFPLLGLKFAAVRGQAIFFTYTADGRHDMRSLHSGLPPTTGEKWIAVKFIREAPILWREQVEYA